ncbi:MAG: Acetolactate synthase large subunit [Candidatus Methanosuratincola subterraneus]|uniref:Acetolactate synthase large subunit n=1 Tax=Methanosuratincola subterraneus TaxID=2593994 RepID=A0A3S3VBF6_METS7|nr:MAG: Acetolactate synthase large subunit [Candidatus Methanosuratincola subterraneus]
MGLGRGLNTSQVVVSALERFGARAAFGMPGMWSLPLYDALLESGIRHILVRHEQNAAYAADGYARASGGFGLCIATAGPGAVNAAAGTAAPYKDHSPVMVVTGHVPRDEIGRGWVEDIDLQAIFRPVTKSSVLIGDPAAAHDLVAEAYRTAMEGCPGPVHIALPGDVQRMPSSEKGYLPTISRCEPDPADISSVLDEISRSRAPLILVGRGAALSGCGEGILALSSAIGAPVVSSYMGRGAVPEDAPQALGPVGRRGIEVANRALDRCDLLISLGCRLTNMTIVGQKPRCPVIQVDIEPRNFSPIATSRVRSDVGAFVDALLPRVKYLSRQFWSPGEAAPADTDGVAKGYAKAIAGFRDAIFAVDIGQHTVWAMQAIRVTHPRGIIFSGNLSAMGFSIPAAMGAKVALPNKRVIAVVGDGGFQMAAPELSTMRENGIAVAVCVFNNGTLGLIRQLQESVYGRTIGVDYASPPDYVRLAEAHGVGAIRARSPQDVVDAIAGADGPLVIEIPVPRGEGIPLSRSRLSEK